MKTLILFPDQLFSTIPFKSYKKAYIVEDPHYFSAYHYNKLKLLLHRISMRHFANKHKTEYIEHKGAKAFYRSIKNIDVEVLDPINYALENYLKKTIKKLTTQENPNFFLTRQEILTSPKPFKRHYYFYLFMRKKLNILMNKNGTPIKNQWTFDELNRKKLPKDHTQLPDLEPLKQTKELHEAQEYILANFPENPGNIDNFWVPYTRTMALQWLNNFMQKHLALFGPYQDAITLNSKLIYHSGLSAMINIGLLSPHEVINKACAQKNIPINSLEGFVRQIIGWREYAHFHYVRNHKALYSSNSFSFKKRKLENYWYTGSKKLPTIINWSISCAFEWGYLHHILRLMVMANYMTLSHIHPDKAYQWFMEFSVDAYDWVMAFNVYAMGTYACRDFTRKAYISSYNYIYKMSGIKDEQSEHWNTLYKDFMKQYF